jgi:hypothetical protein
LTGDKGVHESHRRRELPERQKPDEKQELHRSYQQLAPP